MSVPPTDVPGLLAAAAAASPDRPALVEAGGRRLTWAELDEEVGRIATGLSASGLVAGQRVLMALGNRVEFVTTYLGALRAQAVAVPVNPRATAGEIARMTADSGARLVVADADTVTVVREGLDLLARAVDGDSTALERVDPDLLARAVPPRLVVAGTTLRPGERSYDHLRADAARWVPPLTDPDRLAALLYTSGTSGRPRAAMLSHRALATNVEQVAAVEPPLISGDDVVLAVLPLFHVYALNGVLGGVLRHGATLVLAEGFDPVGTLDLVDAEGVTVLPLAPPVFARWRDADLTGRLGSLRLVLCGSAPLEPDVAEDFTARTGVPVHQGYGLTEAAPVVSSTLRSEAPARGSVGRPLDGIEVRLVDDRGAPVEGDDPGEICVRGANLFSGYWPDASDGPDADGWWATGDVGYLDAAGDVHLVDRVRELVIVSGFNVYPVEVEDVVREVDGVTEAAVIGAPDELTGEAVVAFVVAPGRDPGEVVDAVGAHCAQRLARFKVPTRVEVVEALPHGVTGKVQKGRLRNQERRRLLGLVE